MVPPRIRVRTRATLTDPMVRFRGSATLRGHALSSLAFVGTRFARRLLRQLQVGRAHVDDAHRPQRAARRGRGGRLRDAPQRRHVDRHRRVRSPGRVHGQWGPETRRPAGHAGHPERRRANHPRTRSRRRIRRDPQTGGHARSAGGGTNGRAPRATDAALVAEHRRRRRLRPRRKRSRPGPRRRARRRCESRRRRGLRAFRLGNVRRRSHPRRHRRVHVGRDRRGHARQVRCSAARPDCRPRRRERTDLA